MMPHMSGMSGEAVGTITYVSGMSREAVGNARGQLDQNTHLTA